MSSFFATLHVGELVVPVLTCSQHVHQSTSLRGLPSSKVYSGELQLQLNLVPGVLLPHWAYQPALALSGYVNFAATDGVSPGLMLLFEEGYCVSYEEHFEPGLAGHPALHCRLSIVARRITKQGIAYESAWPAPGA